MMLHFRGQLVDVRSIIEPVRLYLTVKNSHDLWTFSLASINREKDVLLNKFNIDIFFCLFNNISFINLLNNDRNSYFNMVLFL